MIDRGSFARTFAMSFLRRQAYKPLADLTCVFLEQFTPEQLDEAIKKGWSLVDFLKTRPLQELTGLAIHAIEAYPLVARACQGIVRMPTPRAKAFGLEFMGGLEPDTLIKLIESRGPQYATILSNHPLWVTSELDKVKGLLSVV